MISLSESTLLKSIHPLRYCENWALRPSGFPAIDELFTKPALALSPSHRQLFLNAIKEAFAYHYAQSPEFKGHMDLAGFSAQDLQSVDDLERLPWIFVKSFKEQELLSVPRDEIKVTVTSSGTKGLKTQLFLDAISVNRFLVAMYELYRAVGIVGDALGPSEPSHYLMFTYDIEKAPQMGTAWTDFCLSFMHPALSRRYLIREDKSSNDFRFDINLAVQSYQEILESGAPIRLLGFPAFAYHTFVEIKKRGLPSLQAKAASQSWILTGGGWKNHSGEDIGKSQFARFAEEVTGIPHTNVRDVFGMAEHGVGYLDCEWGRLHIPIYAYAIIRDPLTLSVKAKGEAGLLQLITPLLKSYPSLSLLTTDRARLESSPCRCGRPGDGLEILGRYGRQAWQGCAIRALEYLQ